MPQLRENKMYFYYRHTDWKCYRFWSLDVIVIYVPKVVNVKLFRSWSLRFDEIGLEYVQYGMHI